MKLSQNLPKRMLLLFTLMIVIVSGIHLVSLSASYMVSRYPLSDVGLVVLLFYSTFLLSLALGMQVLDKSTNRISTDGWYREYILEGCSLRILLSIGGFGLCLHLIAKGYIFYTNDVSSLMNLREIWMHQGRDELPATVRVASMAGHLLSSFLYAGLFISSLHVYRSGHINRKIFIYITLFLAMILLYSLAIASKNVVLSSIMLVFLGVSLSIVNGEKSGVKARKRTVLFTVFILAIVAFTAIVLMTAKVENSKEFKNYMQGYTDELPINPAEKHDVDSPGKRRYCVSCEIVYLYVNHGLWNFSEVMSTDKRGKKVLFAFAYYWADRVGLRPSSEPGKKSFGRGGMTLVGSAYHDYGIAGVVITALILSMLLLLATKLLMAGGVLHAMGMVLYVATGITILYSLIFVGPAVISFPFIIFSLVITFITIHVSKFREVDAKGASHVLET